MSQPLQWHKKNVDTEHLYVCMSPTKIKKQIFTLQYSFYHLKKKLKCLQQANRRLQKKYKSLQEIINDLRKKDLISSQCSEMLTTFDHVHADIFKRVGGQNRGIIHQS